MPAAVFNLTATDNAPNNYSIEQGATFDWLIFKTTIDYSTYTPRGQIKTDFTENEGEILADFSFAPITFGSIVIGGVTTTGSIIQPLLTDEETGLIPAIPVLRTSSDQAAIPGLNVYVYDIFLDSPTGEAVKFARGFVEVQLCVTDA